MVEVKGTAIQTIPIFIKEKFGEENFKKWLEALPPESQKIFSGIILNINWYPFDDAYTTPLQVMCEMFFDGSSSGSREGGAFSAQHALSGAYKYLIKFGTPNFILNKAASIMTTYYRPVEAEFVPVDKKKGIIRIKKFENLNELAELRILGWTEKALEISGAKNPSVVVTKSLTKGDDVTDIAASWD